MTDVLLRTPTHCAYTKASTALWGLEVREKKAQEMAKPSCGKASSPTEGQLLIFLTSPLIHNATKPNSIPHTNHATLLRGKNRRNYLPSSFQPFFPPISAAAGKPLQFSLTCTIEAYPRRCGRRCAWQQGLRYWSCDPTQAVKWMLLSRVWPFATSWTAVHGILQARILKWVAIPFSRGSSQPRDQTQVSRFEGRFFIS